MNTVVSGKNTSVTIGPDEPIVMIGERINPSGKKKLAAALKQGDLDLVRREARIQVEAGAGIIDVNVVAPGVNEVEVLPFAVEAVLDEIDVPICIDINDVGALEAALARYPGKAIVNSVTGEESSLAEVLPVAKAHGAAVIGLTMDDNGIPKDADTRVAIADKILERATREGIPSEDVIIDCLALTLGADGTSAVVTLDAIRRVKSQLGVNQTLGASNVSYGLPERELINQMFLAAAVAAGITCPTVDPTKMRTPRVGTGSHYGSRPFCSKIPQGLS